MMTDQKNDWRDPGCRVVCRPNRLKQRKFTAKSVGSAAKYALNAGEEPALIVAHVLLALGYDRIVCNASRAINDFSALLIFFQRVKSAAAILTSLSVLLEWLKNGPITKLPQTRAILILVIAVSALMDGILGVLGRWQLFSLKMQIMQASLGAWCGWIRVVRVEQGGTYDTEDDAELPESDSELPDDVPFMTEEEFKDGIQTQ